MASCNLRRWVHLLTLSLHICSTFGTGRVPAAIGRFTSFDHGIRSGEVTILNEKTVRVQDFHYDGKGPAGWFVVGKGNDFKNERAKLKGVTVIRDENGSCHKLQRYEGKLVKLVLPGKMTFKEFNYLAVYCLEYQKLFGYIQIPKNLTLPLVIANSQKECKTKWNSSGGESPTHGTIFKFIFQPSLCVIITFTLNKFV